MRANKRRIVDAACICVIIAAPLAAWAASAQSEIPAENIGTAPKVTVVDAFDGQSAYAKSASSADLQTRWNADVLAPYLERCAGGGEYAPLARMMVSQPASDLPGLQQELTVLQKSEASVREAVKDTFSRAEKLLPGPDVQLCLFAADPAMLVIRDMKGVSGVTAGTGKIVFQVRPEGEWLKRIPFAFAHEYHHSAWTSRLSGRPAFDLAQYLVFEGRADSFAHLLFPDQIAPWDDSLTREDEAAVWKQMQPDLNTADMMRERHFMFGGFGVPRWAGYTIGYHIVQAWLRKHPKAAVEDWTRLDAHALIAQSGYAP